MKRSAPIAGLTFCGLALLLPLVSTAVLCSGLIWPKLKRTISGIGKNSDRNEKFGLAQDTARFEADGRKSVSFVAITSEGKSFGHSAS
jgi:hypothetical protein